MMKFSSPVFSEAPLHGLKGRGSVSCLMVTLRQFQIREPLPSSTRFSGPVAPEPELDGAPLPPEGSPVRQLLDWVYLALRQAQWPVFQQGVFEPAGEGDFDGCYHLVSRIGARMLPSKLFENVWLDATETWSETGFRQSLMHMIGRVQTAFGTSDLRAYIRSERERMRGLSERRRPAQSSDARSDDEEFPKHRRIQPPAGVRSGSPTRLSGGPQAL